jgi:hypothetical protein
MDNLKQTTPAAGQHKGEAFDTAPLYYSIIDEKTTKLARLTVITATKPKRITKQYHLTAGELTQVGGGVMVAGNARVVDVVSLDELAALLKSLSVDQALCYGVPEANAVDVVTRDAWQRMGKPESPIPRIKDAFFWPAGYAVMMFDYDPAPNQQPLDRSGLIEALHMAVPALREVSCLWFPSSSSHITNTETGEDLTGLKGQRLYFIVKDGGDIERAGKDLQTYLWAVGHGYIMVSTAGTKLKRTAFDASVWQTNRLDFAAGAACIAPLEQRRGEPQQIKGRIDVLDTQGVIPPPNESIRTRSQMAIQAAMGEADEDAQIVRHGYIESVAYTIAGKNADDEGVLARAKKLVERALNNHTLAGDFPLVVIAPDGTKMDVTVGDLLDNRETYHGLMTLDPIEPEYSGGRPVGKLYLMSATPGINSFAHGGRFFKLTRPPAMVELVRGKTVEVMEQVLRLMRQSPEAYDFGGPLVVVGQGEVHPLDKHSLMHWLGSTTQFWRWHKLPNGNQVEVLEDPPSKVADQLLAIGKRRQLKRLEAVITAPVIRPDGSLLSRLGFDELTGLLLDANEDDLFPVPLSPTQSDVKAALERLMRPFVDFPLVGMLDKSVLLAALLTAAVRPVLKTAPAFGFDAPVQGSGKTLLAKCIAVMANGQRAKIQPHCKEEEEIRKRLMTILLESPRAVVWDNIIGTFDSASLAGLLTSATYTDRILGVSKSADVPNRAVWLLTGNNLTLAGDMPRRVLKCRIDPQTERPFARRFDLEPESYCLKNRQRMVADALTIIRGWFAAGSPQAPGQMASFEEWDTLVRQPVAWIASHVADFGEYDDVMQAVDDAQAQDPEQEMWGELLDAWFAVFGNTLKTTREVLVEYNAAFGAGAAGDLSDALDEYKGNRPITSRTLGKIFQYRADRLVNGKRMRKINGGGNHANQWRVEQIS